MTGCDGRVQRGYRLSVAGDADRPICPTTRYTQRHLVVPVACTLFMCTPLGFTRQARQRERILDLRIDAKGTGSTVPSRAP